MVDPLANEIIRGEISEHDIIKLVLSDGIITFKAKRVVKQDVKRKDEKVIKDDVKEKEDPSLKKEVPGKKAPSDEKLQELLNNKSAPDKSKKVVESKKCKGCGADNPASNRWCWKCGRDLK